MDDKNGNPLEIPDNKPESNEKPIRAVNNKEEKRQKQMKAVKIAYAFAILLAVGGAFVAKIATENAMGELNVPLESDYITFNPTYTPTEEPDFEVRQNLQDVPDTRENEITEKETVKETEPSTEETTPYAVPFKDSFHSPTGGKVVNKFENSKPIYNETLGEWRTHPAADYKGAEGANVTAIAYGIVENIYDDALYGTVIEIDHGNSLFVRYCGLNKDTIEVKKGDSVKAQQTLGFLGTVPAESKMQSHLHLEVIYDGKLIDPENLINN